MVSDPTRTLPTSDTPGLLSGDSYIDAVYREVFGLWQRAWLPLSNVAGTNVITADVLPGLAGALVGGMCFILIPANTITGAPTLKVGTTPAKDIVNSEGGALVSGQIVANGVYPMFYSSVLDKFVAVNIAAGGTGSNLQTFSVTGTWNKPAGLSSDALVLIQVWGGGGGGSSTGTGGGGGGGGYNYRFMRAGDLASTVAVTIGAGGAVNTAGGNSSFGSHVTAYGGGGASGATQGAGGGGQTSAGGASVGGGPANGVYISDTAYGYGPSGGFGSGSTGLPGAGSFYGGGGGGPGNGSAQGGGSSVWGGGGGTGNGASAVGGTSVYAGNGGTNGQPGQAPAGGGGRNAAGAAGFCRVHIIGK